MSVDENVGDPDGPSTPSTQVGTARLAIDLLNGENLETPKVVSQNFQRVIPDAEWGWWWLYITNPPCVTRTQVERSAADVSGSYTCLTEEQLAGDPSQVAGMLPWTRGDWPLLNAVRQIHGATGVPVPVATLGVPEVTDERSTVRPTSFRVRIMYAFAIPAEGWTAPAEN